MVIVDVVNATRFVDDGGVVGRDSHHGATAGRKGNTVEVARVVFQLLQLGVISWRGSIVDDD